MTHGMRSVALLWISLLLAACAVAYFAAGASASCVVRGADALDGVYAPVLRASQPLIRSTGSGGVGSAWVRVAPELSRVPDAFALAGGQIGTARALEITRGVSLASAPALVAMDASQQWRMLSAASSRCHLASV